MAELGRLWAGRAFGTNTGNLFAEFDSKTGALTGTLRFLDAIHGLVIYDMKGKFDGAVVELEGDATQALPGIATGHLTAKAALTPAGHLAGQWSTVLGTGGTFELFPHDALAVQAGLTDSAIPEQLYTKRITIGAVRLYAQDVRSLAQVVKKEFSSGRRVVVTYRSDGVENSRYLEDFENEVPKLGKLDYFRINIQEPEAYGLNRNVMVELNAQGANQIVVQGILESWVIGKAEAIAGQVKRYEKPVVTNFKRWGGATAAQIVFLLMLLAAPEINPLWRRFVFAGIVIVLLIGFAAIHKRYVPTASIYMTPRVSNMLQRAWPVILSWVSAVTAALAAAYAFYLLQGQPPP